VLALRCDAVYAALALVHSVRSAATAMISAVTFNILHDCDAVASHNSALRCTADCSNLKSKSHCQAHTLASLLPHAHHHCCCAADGS
jgi:hypothetical protein